MNLHYKPVRSEEDLAIPNVFGDRVLTITRQGKQIRVELLPGWNHYGKDYFYAESRSQMRKILNRFVRKNK